MKELNKQVILKEAEKYVYHELKDEGSGHDFWHVYRVTKTAMKIAQEEHADFFICKLAALLHDIGDRKSPDSETQNLEKIKKWLVSHRVDEKDRRLVLDIISGITFDNGEGREMKTLEGKVVQEDADRLDAIGAIGIARVFSNGGSKGQLIYHPDIKPDIMRHGPIDPNRKETSINRFYEKLLKNYTI
ncbi:HD domain-containing protein [Terrilactibacillus sp. S3-3]|nr:HD domain-containing protein [Terrilactibacillus sp. S3-3]